MVTLLRYFKSHRTIMKKNVIEVPKSFCLAVFCVMQFICACFPTAFAEMLLTSKNCFSSCMLREKAIWNVYLMFEVSIHK